MFDIGCGAMIYRSELVKLYDVGEIVKINKYVPTIAEFIHDVSFLPVGPASFHSALMVNPDSLHSKLLTFKPSRYSVMSLPNSKA